MNLHTKNYLDHIIEEGGEVLDGAIAVYEMSIAPLIDGLTHGRPGGGPVGWEARWQQQVDDAREAIVYLRKGRS